MSYFSLFLILSGILFNTYLAKPHHLENQQDDVQMVDLEISHTLGQQIDIKARFKTSVEIDHVDLFIESENQEFHVTETIFPSNFGEIYFIYPLSESKIQVFSKLFIWFEFKLTDGSTYSFKPTTYYYDDNRFNWQSISTKEFNIFWYGEDSKLGETILEIAYDGLTKINSFMEVPIPQGIKIYTYANPSDLQNTLVFSGEITSWIAGHAKPSIDTIIVSLPNNPDRRAELRRQIPHELTHVLLSQKLGSSYENLPRWLNEGLATYAELTPNLNYETLLVKSFEKESLIRIETLCDNFPIDAANFQLAYAESYAFTKYLHDKFGERSLETLIQQYAEGLSCRKAVQVTFNNSLSELNDEWRGTQVSDQHPIQIDQKIISLIVLVGFAFIIPVILILRNIDIRKLRK